MSNDRNEIFSRGEEFLQLFSRGADFTRELLIENERLRNSLAQLENEQAAAARSPEEWDKYRHELISRLQDLESEYESVRVRLHQVEEENQQFAERYLEIEEENNNLANLYVASYQLHSTLDPSEVLRVIVEIVINLIGAEVFCVYACSDDSERLEPVASEGADLDAFPTQLSGVGMVGEAIASGNVVTAEVADPAAGVAAGSAPIVAIPLRVEDERVGVIAVYRLLQQKTGFTALDHELFTLLAGHAATAIFASRLYAQSERKLSTIQGFIDLLTK